MGSKNPGRAFRRSLSPHCRCTEPATALWECPFGWLVRRCAIAALFRSNRPASDAPSPSCADTMKLMLLLISVLFLAGVEAVGKKQCNKECKKKYQKCRKTCREPPSPSPSPPPPSPPSPPPPPPSQPPYPPGAAPQPPPPPPRAPPPLPPSVPPSPKLPCVRPIDFALVLDESGSMGSYMEGDDGLKAFAKELVRLTAVEPR